MVWDDFGQNFYQQLKIFFSALEVVGCISLAGASLCFVFDCWQLECGDMQRPGSWPVSTDTHCTMDKKASK